ncbi:fucose-binding lectin II [Kitasatospora sp. NBC_01266]|uniref:fucose-binding lectin II n=1 Tax=Kitasatospora sp. NBC_01266 TaxID=2903572 RepID=UPI002E2FF6CA|nr:fucose-binding lectin II [Kitasatospora sp. NBC_01266]
MSDAYVLVNGDKAEVGFPAGAEVAVRVKTNSRRTQIIRVTSADGSVDQVFSGSGERGLAGEATITGAVRLSATFEYHRTAGRGAMPSALNSGGPYRVGQYNLMVVVAENGDDVDYDDAVLEFSWYTPR